MILKLSFLSLSSFLLISSCAGKKTPTSMSIPTTQNTAVAKDTVTLGNGCFWCTEAIFQQVEGVISVESGYSGGSTENPTYKEVCTGTTGHAECLNIVYNPMVISYDELLEIFWQTHDPTTLNRQGNDVGTQYRSVIFYRSPQQKQIAEAYIQKLDSAHAFENPIVTTLEPFEHFYKAENYHQNYFNENGSQPYCQLVIKPKLDKFKKVFKHKLKSH